MSEAKPYQPPEWQQPKPQSKGSPLKWILIGCGGLFLVGLLSCAGVMFWGYSFVSKQVEQLTQEFEAKGYEKQMGQVIDISQSPAKKTVFVAQVLKINKDVDVDIAVACQVMEVHANIHGDVDFLGQMMKVDAGCVIDGDLRIKNAQVVEIYGEVKGKITGNYMVLNYKGKQYSAGQSPTAPADAEKAVDAEKAEPKTPEKPVEPPPPVAAPEKPQS